MATVFDRISGNDEIFNNKEYISDSMIFNAIESARYDDRYSLFSDHRNVIIMTYSKGPRVWLWTSSAIKDDTNKLMDAAEIAAEVMRMQLLATNAGAPTISIATKDNMIYTYNYDPDGTYAASHYVALASNRKWTAPTTAKPLDDIRTGVNFLRGIGENPRYALMTNKTFGYLAECDQIKNAIASLAGITLTFISDDAVRDAFERLTGLRILLYDKQYINYAGATTNFYPDDQVTILPEGELGKTFYGSTPEERTLITNGGVDVAMYDDRIACTVVTRPGPPVSVNTTVSQLCLPSYEGMDGTYVIKVN